MKNLLIALSLAVLSTAPSTQALADLKAIVNATIVDLDGGDPLADAVVLIDRERIVEIGAADAVQVPDRAELIDVGGAWLLPGLMNLHVHLGIILPGQLAAELGDETVPELTLRMAANAREALYSGVTTIRLTGERAHTGIALGRAIEKGQAIGPRIFSAGDGISITAGHGEEGETFDGPDELIKATRTEIAAGASWIKISISGGIATDSGAIAEALMTPAEIAAVVDAAHRFNTPVAAHSGSSAATQSAIDAGVDCIEHGYTLDRAVLARMAEKGTWLVPTIVVSQPETQPFFEKIGSPPWYLERRESVGTLHWQALQTAIEEGVNIALGTDMLPQEPIDGTTATVRAAEYYVDAGMTPVEALRSATIEAATLLRIQDETGSLEPGKYADIIAVTEDPAEDISALRNIVFVMKGGTVYRNEVSE